MTEEIHPDSHETNPSVDESTGDEALDRRLAEPILRGDKGLDTAQIWISGFLIILAGAIAYSNAIAIPFHGADYESIVNNSALHHPATFAQALDAQRPRAAAMLSLTLNWWFTKGNATSFHVVNLAIHLVNGLLVFLLCRLLLKGKASEAIAMLAGLLFVLHPTLTESVNLAVGRAELLATFFSLLSLLLFARGTNDTGRPHYTSLGASWLCYFLAMASHENAFFLPFFLILFHYRIGAHSPWKNRRLLYLPYLALLLVWAVSGASGTRLNPFGSIVGSTACVHLAQSLCHSVYPANLSVWRDQPAALSSPLAWGIGMNIVMAVALAAVCRFRASAIAWSAALWIFALAFVELAKPAGSFVSDRDQYFALVGATLLVPALLVSMFSGPRARVVGGLLSAVLVISAGVATFSRNNVWIDEPTLWQDAAAKAPKSAKPQQALGEYYLEQGRNQVAQLRAVAAQSNKAPEDAQIRSALEPVRQAEQFLSKAKEFDAQDAKTLASLGEAQTLLDKNNDAIENLLAALRLDTSNPSTTLALATALDDSWRATGRREDLFRAMDYFRRAESFGPLPTEAAARYGLNSLAMGDLKVAESALRAAVGSETNSPLAAPLKETQDRQKKIDTATSKVLSLLSENPNNPEGLRLLGQVYILSGHYQNTLYTANQVLKDAPQDLEAWIQMGVVEARMKAIDRFVAEWPAPQGSPWNQLALTCASVGLWDDALTYLGKSNGGMTAQPPLLQMGEIATQLKQPRRAWEYYRRAAEALPDDPRPWLHLADIATAAKSANDANNFLVEAAKRNADPNEIATRRQKLGVPEPQPLSGAVKTMIR